MHGNYKHRAMPTGTNSELEMGSKRRRSWKRKWRRRIRLAEREATRRIVAQIDEPDGLRDDPPRYMYET